MRSLTNDFENMMCTIEESKDLSTLTIEELVNERRSWNLLRNYSKWRERHITLKEEDNTKEVKEMVLVIDVKDKKKRKNKQLKNLTKQLSSTINSTKQLSNYDKTTKHLRLERGKESSNKLVKGMESSDSVRRCLDNLHNSIKQ